MIYRKPVNKNIYRQYDKRWAMLPYPTANYTFKNNGCGCCAVTHCIIERDKYKNYTPASVQPYMKQFATKGHGTEWKGIREGLKHYGLKDVKDCYSMSAIYTEMRKGDAVAVFLFTNHKANVSTGYWTSGGHYVAAVGYKEANGKHYFYMKDSGSRKHDGWYCYETTMKNCIRVMFVGHLPKETDDAKIYLPKKGYFTLGDKSPQICKIQKFLKKKGFYNGTVATKSGRIGPKTYAAIKKWQKASGLVADGKWGPKSNAKYEEQR